MTPKGPRSYRPSPIRLSILPLVMAIGLAIIAVRLWSIQIMRSSALKARAEASRFSETLVPAPRGVIYDAKGIMLAGVRARGVVRMVYRDFVKRGGSLGQLATTLGVAPDKLKKGFRAAAETPTQAAVIYDDLDIVATTRLAESAYRFPGVTVEPEPTRFWPDETSMTHVLGYVGPANDRDEARLEEQGRTAIGPIGKTGLERARDARLTGEPGILRTEVDRLGRPLRRAGGGSPPPH